MSLFLLLQFGFLISYFWKQFSNLWQVHVCERAISVTQRTNKHKYICTSVSVFITALVCSYGRILFLVLSCLCYVRRLIWSLVCNFQIFQCFLEQKQNPKIYTPRWYEFHVTLAQYENCRCGIYINRYKYICAHTFSEHCTKMNYFVSSIYFSYAANLDFSAEIWCKATS